MKKGWLIILLITVFAFAQKGKIEKEGWLGVYSKNLSEPMRIALAVEHGVLVTDVVKESPAEKGGIEIGDVILKIDGKVVSNQDDLRELVRSRPNQEVVIELLRKGKIKEISLTIGERDKTEPRKFSLDLPHKTLSKVKKYLAEFEPFWEQRAEKYQRELMRLKEEIKELRQELKELKEKLKERK